MSCMTLFSRIVLSLTFGLVACSAESPVQTNQSEPIPPERVPFVHVAQGSLSQSQASDPISQNSPIFIRIIKSGDPRNRKGRLEVFSRNLDGTFSLESTHPICTWSGALGPKLKQGDGQSPEGFYFITKSSLNPNSSYHLSFNLGYPNAYDRAHGRTGDFLMVHGERVSIGCYAMTNDGIDVIYDRVETAFETGQSFIRVHIFPFEMTEANLAAYAANPNAEFWTNLMQGWDWFETYGAPPNVTVRNKTYQFDSN